jgi:hypothetical protein
MTILSRTLCLWFLALLPAGAGANPPDLATVLDHLIRSYGGEENIRKLDNVYQEWRFVALRGNRHGIDVRSIRLPRQLRVELTYPDKQETRILNGDTSHVIFGDEPARTAGQHQRDAMRLQLMRLYTPLTLRDRIDSLTLILEGRNCALSLIENGLRADYLVNMDTWRIEKVVGTLTVNGAGMRFLTEYSDFEFHEGALIHRKENKFAGGVHTAVLQLHRITLDAELDTGSFLPR